VKTIGTYKNDILEYYFIQDNIQTNLSSINFITVFVFVGFLQKALLAQDIHRISYVSPFIQTTSGHFGNLYHIYV
jgi:hypothetical protein